MATQIRQYQIADGEMDAFVEWFPSIVPVRAKFGFTLDWAYVDRENNRFMWSTSHDGDFDAAVETYNASPERAAVFEGVPKRVEQMDTAMVDVLGL